MNCHIEIYLNGRWQIAATFEPYPTSLNKGTDGACRLEYDVDYAVGNLGNLKAELIPGLDVGFELFRFESWPPFLIDLLPSGAGRRVWLRRMQIAKDGLQVEWLLLIKGAGNPPGHLRIAEAVLPPPPDQFKIGFPRIDILEQREDFLEYAAERGAHVAGGSSVQGEAPKYLLVEDSAGMFHAEGSLPDGQISKFWLVKFPRGRRADERNQQILRNEASYLEVARRFGIRTGEPLEYQNETLFVPRFDRVIENGAVVRHGMHSLYALANIPGFGASVHHDVYCQSLAKYVTDPGTELREYLLRDVLNLALRNTDNHGRNSAILRIGDQVSLSPLFDFAPMFLDPEGINRVSRWDDERPGNQPEWGTICAKLNYALDPLETRMWLTSLGEKVK
ncbi:MAG: type II toxin-antitoxin system HipA family toxin, partial [Geopsychrobacter sp.]|nr:type II toxin-antitoxin system HipA family toxin [Geopsychrobacter sp.]